MPMKRFWKQVRAVPRWGWAFGFVYFGLQYGMYRLGDWLSRVLGIIERAFPCKIPALDDLIMRLNEYRDALAAADPEKLLPVRREGRIAKEALD